MEMRIKECTLTYVKEFDDDVTPEEMLIGAYELIAKVYSQQSVINAYYNTDPDTMDIQYNNNILESCCGFVYDVSIPLASDGCAVRLVIDVQ